MMHFDNACVRHGLKNFSSRRAAPGDIADMPVVFAAVLFADIKGFTRFCQTVDPQTAFRALLTFHERMREVILSHGATVMTQSGDEVMAAWCGSPSGVCVRALECGFAMLRAMAGLNANDASLPLEMNIGVGI